MKVLLAIAICISMVGTVEAAKKKNRKGKKGNSPVITFQIADANGDRLVTPREFGNVAKIQNVADAFTNLDTDKSGSLTASEFGAASQDLFKAEKKKGKNNKKPKKQK